MDGVWSVSELVSYLGDMLDQDDQLAGLWLAGELSNLSQSSAGHAYFTLKDAASQVKCVLFRGSGKGQSTLLQHGSQILVHGRVGIYEAQGTLQLYVDQVQRAGLGALHLQFEALVARLREEGLFDEARKRQLPALPRRIGVVTSAQAAAFRDICRVLQTRFPAVEVVLAPTLVQGTEAPPQIVAALQHLGRLPAIEVIIVARGGGSLEDLWAFNDERVARAIAGSPVPVVTGIGHETDTTIADYAADLRAPTPSAAAAAVVPDREEILALVSSLQEELSQAVRAFISPLWSEGALLQRELALRSPARRIAQYHQQLDDMMLAARERVDHFFSLRRAQLDSSTAQLAVLDPRRTLERGYALVMHDDGSIVRGAATLHGKDHVRLHFHDGSVAARISS